MSSSRTLLRMEGISKAYAGVAVLREARSGRLMEERQWLSLAQTVLANLH